ncbi:type II toxin-antitoxin system VapC family toxin [soil metagenome]
MLDANLLVYAHVRGFSQHDDARTWLDDQLTTATRVGLPWPSLLAFLRLVTNPRIFERPEPLGEAWGQVQEWLAAEPAWVPVPTPRHGDVLASLLGVSGAGGNLVPDAHLAALAVEHGVVVASTDGDFARFPGVRWVNPLV